LRLAAIGFLRSDEGKVDLWRKSSKGERLMDAVICDLCGRVIDRPATREMIRFEVPVFQQPDNFMMQKIDLCMACGFAFSQTLLNLKRERQPIKR
jgi:hypothetical protein